MEPLIERRLTGAPPSLSFSEANTTRIVQQGIALQTSLGSVGAIEYLKARSIASVVIARVLAGGQVRCEDDTALGRPSRMVN